VKVVCHEAIFLITDATQSLDRRDPFGISGQAIQNVTVIELPCHIIERPFRTDGQTV
jgi:hypothetical protein